MKLGTLRDCYEEASGKVSELVRQLALGGVAVIWIFRVGQEAGGIKFEPMLLWPLAFFVISLALDLLQYVSKTIILGSLNHHYWKKHHDDEKEIPYDSKWNWPAHIFFYGKTVALIVAYVMLLIHVFSQIGAPVNAAVGLLELGASSERV